MSGNNMKFIQIFIALIFTVLSLNVFSADFERISGSRESYKEKWNKSKKPVHKALKTEKYKKQKKLITNKQIQSKKLQSKKTKSSLSGLKKQVQMTKGTKGKVNNVLKGKSTKSSLSGLKKQVQITNGTKSKVNNIFNKKRSISKSKQRRQQYAKKRSAKR